MKKYHLNAVKFLRKGTYFDDIIDSFDTVERAENMKTNIEKIIQPGGLRQRNGRHHGMIHQRVINPCSIMLIIITMKSYLECNGMQKRMSSNLQFILTFERKGGEFTFLQNYFLNN